MTDFQNLKQLVFGRLQQELHPHYHYHNVDHTADVVQAAESIAENENINQANKRLLLTAALFHDTGFIKGSVEHEVASCEIARNTLPGFGYDEDEIARICGMIRATRVPQSPQNHLEQILCDADLDYLGRDDFFDLSARLFRELQLSGAVKDEQEWDERQADFIGNHSYFTKTSIARRKEKEQQHANEIKSKISSNVHHKKQ